MSRWEINVSGICTAVRFYVYQATSSRFHGRASCIGTTDDRRDIFLIGRRAHFDASRRSFFSKRTGWSFCSERNTRYIAGLHLPRGDWSDPSAADEDAADVPQQVHDLRAPGIWSACAGLPGAWRWSAYGPTLRRIIRTIGSMAEEPSDGSTVVLSPHRLPNELLDLLRNHCCTKTHATCPLPAAQTSAQESSTLSLSPLLIERTQAAIRSHFPTSQVRRLAGLSVWLICRPASTTLPAPDSV